MARGNGVNAFGANASSAPASNPDEDESQTKEQDHFMPIANVIRIMRRILPPHAKISDDAKETIQECVSEYISFVTGEANERCRREQRKTVTADDVVWSMGKLGFDDYVEPLTVFLHRFRDVENDRSVLRGDSFVRNNNGSMEFGPVGVGPYRPPPPSTQQQHGFMMGRHGVGYDPGYMGGYYTDGAGSSQNALMNNYDPYGQFMGKTNGK